MTNPYENPAIDWPPISHEESPTKMEMLVGLVSKTAKSDAMGSVHPISVRIPTVPFSTIQAISKHSGMSMNKTIVWLLDAALDEVLKQLPKDDLEQIEGLRDEILAPLVFSGGDAFQQPEKGDI